MPCASSCAKMSPNREVPIPTQTQTADEAEEIQTVLSSETFSTSPSLTRLLKYLCNNHFSENRSVLNEYRIGVEALGRPVDFDPSKNSSVRVEVHRLRAKLRGYYETTGANHPVRIILEEGHYGLQFVRCNGGPALGESQESTHSSELSGETSAQNSSAAVGRDQEDHGNRFRILRRLSPKGMAIVAAAVVVAIVAVWVTIWGPSRGSFARTVSAAPPRALSSAPAANPDSASVLILAGYQKEKYIDRDGSVWGGDRYFTGGEAVELKLPYIEGAADITLYRTARTGDFSYDIPVKPGNYELSLHFVETIFGPGTLAARGESSRVFSVFLNGRPLLTDFDILSEAGGSFRAFTRVFKGVS